MPRNYFNRVAIFYRSDISRAGIWAKKIRRWIRTRHPRIQIDGEKPQAVIVVGGDGTILEASRIYAKSGVTIVGLHLGGVGFLASVRDEANFLGALDKFFRGRYLVNKRMMLEGRVLRNNIGVFDAIALNEIAVENLLGIAELEIDAKGHSLQFIRGTGVIVATGTGSTAYNLSAHGPIVAPAVPCLVVTELLDHGIPTPSMVLSAATTVAIKVKMFRKRGLLTIASTGEPADTLFVADGAVIFPLEVGDEIRIRRAPNPIRFAEFEKNYFFKSLEDKFALK